MTHNQAVPDGQVEQVNRQLDELRRSFDADMCQAPPHETVKGEVYLLLALSGATYGCPILHVCEILPVPTIVPVPNVPPAMLGIVNLHGHILSVTTIHRLLGLKPAPPADASRIVVTKGIPVRTGILADKIEGMAEVRSEQIQPLSATIADDTARLLTGHVYAKGRIVSLLDMEQLNTALEHLPT